MGRRGREGGEGEGRGRGGGGKKWGVCCKEQ